MSKRVKSLFANLMLLAGTFVFCFLIAEFVVFRYVLVPDDVLPNATANGVVRYVPNTTARFRHPDGRGSLVTINAQGWNSTKTSYRFERSSDTPRIAVVGDSYVHGAFVDTKDGFPEVLERTLNDRSPRPVEVLRFGMDGAPLSQYLHMIRREVLPFHPDVVVVQLIHNDFDESFRFLKTRYSSSFMKMKRNPDGTVTEILPSPFKPGLADMLRSSATFRYVYYETNLYLKLKSLVSKHFWGGTEVYEPEFISSAVDIRNLEDTEQIRFFTRHIMAELKRLADAHGFKLIFAMDGVREAIYDAKPIDAYAVGKLNQIAEGAARDLELPFIALQETFSKHYQANGQRFEYDYDWHWNKLGNELVGERLATYFLNNPELLQVRNLKDRLTGLRLKTAAADRQ